MPATDAISSGEARPRAFPRGLLSELVRRLSANDTGLKRANYPRMGLALALIAPQLVILLFFFFIPSFKALSMAFIQTDPFGGRTIFVGLQNFADLFADPGYRYSAWLTLWFTLAQNFATLAIAGVLAFATDYIIRMRATYRGVILLPYAIAPVISGAIWAYLFNPSVGPAAAGIHALGIPWDPNLRTQDAVILITIASVWKHVCYNYIFLVAAMLAVPQSLRESAAMDGAGPLVRFRTITLPLIAPTMMYLFIINMVYGLFDTFGIIEAVTAGGPAGTTKTLVYKVYQDGFIMMNLGSSAAQSIVLMALAVLFTVLQFRAMDRKVNYQV